MLRFVIHEMNYQEIRNQKIGDVTVYFNKLPLRRSQSITGMNGRSVVTV
jgi:hypothetical protein